MKEFFRGWRRKLGVVTLVTACVFMGWWVRSFAVWDCVTLDGRRTEHIYMSVQGFCSWQKRDKTLDEIVTNGASKGFFQWESHRIQDFDTRLQWIVVVKNMQKTIPFIQEGGEGAAQKILAFPVEEQDSPLFHWEWRFCLLDHREGIWWTRIPYWSITVPLTFISVWLLISKPCKPNQMKIIEPTANEVA